MSEHRIRPGRPGRPADETAGARATAFAAMVVDAWNELRVNRLRILLALVGITVAVIGLTVALGAGTMLRDVMVQTGERQSGRTATVSLHLPSGADKAKLERIERVPNDYGVTHWSHVSRVNSRVWTPSKQYNVTLTAVDPVYETLFRVPVMQGRFLAAEDTERLAPTVVVNQVLWEQLGSPDLRTNPELTLTDGTRTQQAVIVGVTARLSEWDEPHAFAHHSRLRELVTLEATPSTSQIVMWVPEHIADALAQQLNEQLGTSLGVTASRDDWAKFAAAQLVGLQWTVIGAAAGMFVLGALGLVNINLVTMQHRVREIGIRRSYGATSGRIFIGVLLESVVATFVAGLVGVVIAVVLMQNPLVFDLLRGLGVYERSPFPIDAAVIGLVASTVVGAIAGALPALKATRVQIIEAIRF